MMCHAAPSLRMGGCVDQGRGRVLPARVPPRRLEKLIGTLGIARLSSSEVSAMTKDLGSRVEALPDPTVGCRPYSSFLAADALVLKIREAAIRVNVRCTPCWSVP